MGKIAVFKSSMFKVSDEIDPQTQMPPVPGKDWALYCRSLLAEQGLVFEGDEEPIESNGDWFMYASLGRMRVEVVAFWTVLGMTENDSWAVHVRILFPILKRLFGKADPRDESFLIRLVDKALQNEQEKGRICDLRWLDAEEYSNLVSPQH